MLELKHISFEAGEGGTVKEIIRDVNLTLPDNKFIAVTGPNGGGKSTLAKLIVGIEQPIKGQILLDGEDITGLGITERAKKGVILLLTSRVTSCCQPEPSITQNFDFFHKKTQVTPSKQRPCLLILCKFCKIFNNCVI